MPDETHCRRDDAGARSLSVAKGVENESSQAGKVRGNEGLKWSSRSYSQEEMKKGGRII